jgi:hypothetical protein
MIIQLIVLCAALALVAAIITGLLAINAQYGAAPAFVGLASALIVGVWLARDNRDTSAGEAALEDAPDVRTLLRRGVFWVLFAAGTGIPIGALYSVYVLFGFPAMLIAAAGLFLFCVWALSRTGGYPATPKKCSS